jgi:hypothetical protein
MILSIVILLLLITTLDGFSFNSKISFKLLLKQLSSSSSKASSSTTEYNTLVIKTFLTTILSSRSTTKDKQFIIEQLQGLRANENDGSIPRNEDRSTPAVWNGDRQSFLDALLNEIDSVKDIFGIFTVLTFLPSYRVKLLLLKSLMNIILSQEINTSPISIDAGRRRRALSMVLGQLPAAQKGVRGLAKEAAIRKKNELNYEEMLERTPALETPKFNIIYQLSKASHVRKYDKFTVCSLVMDQNINERGGAFKFLAGYIFGKNKSNEKMKMTTPVISSASQKKMSFIMPSNYWTDTKSAPEPIDDVVKVEENSKVLGDEYFAVTWFGGYATKEEVEKKTAELRKTIEQDPEWKLKDTTNVEPLVLQYNDPFQPAWKRRNELMLAVVGKNI